MSCWHPYFGHEAAAWSKPDGYIPSRSPLTSPSSLRRHVGSTSYSLWPHQLAPVRSLTSGTLTPCLSFGRTSRAVCCAKRAMAGPPFLPCRTQGLLQLSPAHPAGIPGATRTPQQPRGIHPLSPRAIKTGRRVSLLTKTKSRTLPENSVADLPPRGVRQTTPASEARSSSARGKPSRHRRAPGEFMVWFVLTGGFWGTEAWVRFGRRQ
jgi:hypothetical protein